MIVSDMISPYLGGSESYCKNVGRELVKLGHNVLWVGMRFSPELKEAETNEDGVKIIRLNVPFNERRLFCLHPKLLSLMKDADVVQFNSFVSAITGGFIAKIMKKPSVGLCHEMFADLWQKFTNNRIEQIIYPAIEKLISINPYIAWIVPCDYTKNTLIKMGVRPEIIKKIPHGIDTKLFHPKYGSFIEKYRLWDRFVILYSGRYGFKGTCYSKNQKVLFDAFKKVKVEIPSAVLLMVGSDFENVRPYIESIGLEIGKDVIYAGKIPDKQMPEFYSSGDVFVSSSLSEGFGFSILEAQACGCPVVAFANGSIPEVVSDNKTGILIKKRKTSYGLAKGIKNIYKYRRMKILMGLNAMRWVKKFSWKKSAKAHSDLYEEVYCWYKINR
jgi:glycosyltransferase involved in cell wall biosynthesis